MILAIVFAYFGYKKANEVGKSGIMWGFIALFAFIGVQFILGLAIGVALELGVDTSVWSERSFDDYNNLLKIAGLIGGLIGGFSVLLYLGRIPKSNDYFKSPQPRSFNEK